MIYIILYFYACVCASLYVYMKKSFLGNNNFEYTDRNKSSWEGLAFRVFSPEVSNDIRLIDMAELMLNISEVSNDIAMKNGTFHLCCY